MVTEKIKELAALEAKAAELKARIETQRDAELATLPSTYGYTSLNDFIKALKVAETKAAGRRGKRGPKPASAKAAKPAKSGKRTRTKITPELKQQVVAAVQAGKSGSEIANQFQISLPSVQNIKKEAGLVKARGTSADAGAGAAS